MFDIKSNIPNVLKTLTQFQREQVPFATIVAMTRTAQALKEVHITEINRVFDRPTPWTLNGLYVQPATKRRPEAAVYFREFAPKGTPAGKYLRPQMHGGQRRHKGMERLLQGKGLLPPGMYVVPGQGAEVDAYGNMSRGQIIKILSYLRAFGEVGYLANRSRRTKSRGTRRREHYFVGSPGGAPLGVWQRKGDGIVPVMIFVQAPQYPVRYRFQEVSARTAAFHFPPHFWHALAQATRSGARRAA
ncbi:hypothetical protein FHP25_35930 [Vineibacter terrae]|uniref:Uncharacterized protein n=1 Tax=Vineibacter terrae TaxID=2586908 RepID=A0A5C8P9T5_9HYPH|nr:hypothetical protein [Vineibacter terrae]TXL70114.1 hypothetical protein FHP25_35930 [Vineibacter terrae]